MGADKSYSRAMSRAAIIVAALACSTPAYAETAYFTAIPDLPIAPGLGEAIDPFGSFVAGDGELVFAFASGRAAPDAVERFYAESLSALGWSLQPSPPGEEITYLRGRERLALHIAPQDGGTYLEVRLVIRPASMNAD